jgi:hypothetical protein
VLVVGKASLKGLCPNCLLGLAWLHTTARLILDHGKDFRRVVRPSLERHHPWRAGLLERNRILWGVLFSALPWSSCRCIGPSNELRGHLDAFHVLPLSFPSSQVEQRAYQ